MQLESILKNKGPAYFQDSQKIHQIICFYIMQASATLHLQEDLDVSHSNKKGSNSFSRWNHYPGNYLL